MPWLTSAELLAQLADRLLVLAVPRACCSASPTHTDYVSTCPNEQLPQL